MKEMFKKKFYVFFIILLILLQFGLIILINSLHFDILNNTSIKSAAEIFIIIVPWLYFLANVVVPEHVTFCYNRLIPNRKNISIIIQSIPINKYNDKELEEEYLDFISDKPYEEYNQAFIEKHMWYILIDHGRKIDRIERSRAAKQYDFIKFCVACELKRTLDSKIIGSYETKHCIEIADRFFDERFEDYYLPYFLMYRKAESDTIDLYSHCPEIECIIEYIKNCFFLNQKPSYDLFLEFAIKYNFRYQYEILHENFKKLKSDYQK